MRFTGVSSFALFWNSDGLSCRRPSHSLCGPDGPQGASMAYDTGDDGGNAARSALRLIEDLDEGILSLDRGLKVTFANRGAASLLGCGKEDLQGKTLREVVDGPLGVRLVEKAGEALARGSSFTLERHTPHDSQLSFRILPGGDGVTVVIQDITEHRKVIEALRESEARYRFVTERMWDVAWTVDTDFRTTYASPSAKRVIGFTPEERMAQDPRDTVTPESFARALELFRQEIALEERGEADLGRTLTFNLEFRCKDGSTVWTENIGSLIHDGLGRVVGARVVSRDITEKMRMEDLLRESELKFQSAFLSCPDAMVIEDLETGEIVDANPAFSSITLWPHEEIVGNKAVDLGLWISPDDRILLVDRVKAGEPVDGVELKARRRDGDIRDVVLWARLLATGSKRYLFFLARDVTEEKAAAVRIRESEAKYRFLTEKTSDLVWTSGMDLKTTYVSPSEEKILGYAPGERIGRVPSEILSPESFSRALKTFQDELGRDGLEGVDPDRTVSLELEYFHKNGSSVWLENIYRFIRDDSGKPSGIYAVCRDITKRKEAEEELKRTEERLVMAQKAGRVVVFDWDVVANRVVATDESMSLLGIREIRKDIADELFALIHPDDLPGFKEGMRAVMNHRLPEFTAEHRVVLQDDTERWLSTRGNFSYDASGRPLRMIGTSVDITSLKAAQETLRKANEDLEHRVAERTRSLLEANTALQEQKETLEDVIHIREVMERDIRKLAAAVAQAQEAITLISPEGIIEYANPATEKLSGYTRGEIVGRSVLSFINCTRYEDMALVKRLLAEKKPWTDRRLRRRKNGEEYLVDVAVTPVLDDDGAVINYVTVGRDVTREVELQNQIAQVQRMNAIGALASGIAFDLRNTFLPIIVNTRMLLESIRVEDPSHAFLGDILQATHHGMDLVEGILTLSRSDIQEKRLVAVSTLVSESVSILKATLPPGIIVRHDLGDCRAMVMADPVQIKQVLISIADNGRHAIGGRNGLISISLATKYLNVRKAMSISLGLDPGLYAEITIRDTGKGMDEETLSLIFEAFFTTREDGQSLGMGLSVAQGIVKGHKGAITAHSRPGKGSTFIVYLPVVDPGTQG